MDLLSGSSLKPSDNYHPSPMTHDANLLVTLPYLTLPRTTLNPNLPFSLSYPTLLYLTLPYPKSYPQR